MVRRTAAILVVCVVSTGLASGRELSFADRVAAQEAIARVYYAHQIGTTRPFEEAVPRAGLENKVRTYLEQSAALAEFWHAPVTGEMLEAELVRMVRDSQMPERLRELFAALDDDAFLIQETLARATVAGRLARASHALDPQKTPWDSYAFAPDLDLDDSAPDPGVTGGSLGDPCVDDEWDSLPLDTAPDPRADHTAVWTGSHMLVWGGYNGLEFLNTGGMYDPATDSWSPISTADAPTARVNHKAVWIGEVMVVWGGYNQSSGHLATGGQYNPILDSWSPTSTVGAPVARAGHTAVWTGSRMVVWGGYDGITNLNTGGRYNPFADSWTPTSTVLAPTPRTVHTAVWTGSRMVVWGGLGEFAHVNTGGRYDPVSNSWMSTSTLGAPSKRNDHTAIWTGNVMVVWGGYSSGVYFNTGGRYDPVTNTWTSTSTVGAPPPRTLHTAVWTGNKMVVWGGLDDPGQYMVTGGRYEPETDNWTPTSLAGVAAVSYLHTMVWTGNAMLVWGGYDSNVIPFYFNTGGLYAVSYALDEDNDGFTVCTHDCNDFDPQIHPGSPEACDFYDNDCDGTIDEDTDGDLHACDADCAPADGGVFATPGEVMGLRFRDRETLAWDSAVPGAGSDTLHDAAAGLLGELPVGSGTAEICLASGIPEDSVDHLESPAPETGHWYLVRARNACGTGSYGAETGGVVHDTAACP